MATEPDAELLSRIDAALADQQVIEAIRLYREAMQVSLIEGRRFIEARKALLPSAAPAEHIGDAVPEQVRRYLDTGHARSGELLAWWRNPRGDFCVLVRYASTPQPLFEIGVFPPVVGHWGHDLNGLRCDLPQLVDALMGEGFFGAEWGRGHPVVATISVALHASLLTAIEPSR